MPKGKRRERSKFISEEVTLLSCTPGNFDCEYGEDATIITIAYADGDIEPLAINMRDTKMLAVKLLISLWTARNKLAGEILELHFPTNKKGKFFWPGRKRPT